MAARNLPQLTGQNPSRTPRLSTWIPLAQQRQSTTKPCPKRIPTWLPEWQPPTLNSTMRLTVRANCGRIHIRQPSRQPESSQKWSTEMPETQTPREPASAPSPHVAALAAAGSAKATRAPKSQAEKVEPTMRALRRILGDYVLEVFPEGFCAAIDALYKAHVADGDMWAVAEYGNQQERDDALKLMRAYAECAGDKGYTIRQDKETSADVLRFRVVVRRGSDRSDAT